jgi:hypothetical protein
MQTDRNSLLVLASSAVLLDLNRLADAADCFDSIENMNYDNLKTEQERLLYFKSLWSWAKKINSERSREMVRKIAVDIKQPALFHYYILILRKKKLYPLLAVTWFFI